MRIEFAWVGADGCVCLDVVDLPEGTTLGEALAAIEHPALLQALGAGRLAAAVFGQLRRPDERLFEGDRIELLEALRVDPKVARQRRVAVRREQAGRGKRGPGA